MIDVRKLRLLTALQRLGTIAAVGEELHISASGVSMQLSALEKELGLTLTRRQGRRVALTAAGLTLAAHGRSILDGLSLAERELDALREGTVGRYTVTAFPSAARTILADTFRRLLGEEGTALELKLTTAEPDEALAALATGSADLAVIHSYSNVPRDVPTDIAVRSLGAEPVWLAVSSEHHPSIAGQSVNLAELSDMPWIAPPPDVTCYSMMERACAMAGFRPRVTVESLDFAVQLELVAAGAGVALVPALTVAHVPEGVVLRSVSTPLYRSLHLAARRPDFADPGIATIAAVIVAASAHRLAAITAT